MKRLCFGTLFNILYQSRTHSKVTVDSLCNALFEVYGLDKNLYGSLAGHLKNGHDNLPSDLIKEASFKSFDEIDIQFQNIIVPLIKENKKEPLVRAIKEILREDSTIANHARASATRVMYTVTEWIEKKLGLKVNASKTHICRPSRLKYLGFGFCKMKTKWEAIPHKDSIVKFKRKLKALCKRNWSIDLDYRIAKLNQVIRGWINYFIIGRMKRHLTNIDEHLRTMIRVIIWKQWKVPSKREWGLKKLGVNKDLARLTAYCGNRYQWVVTKTCVVRAISKEKLTKKGLVSCIDYYDSRRHNLGLN